MRTSRKESALPQKQGEAMTPKPDDAEPSLAELLVALSNQTQDLWMHERLNAIAAELREIAEAMYEQSSPFTLVMKVEKSLWLQLADRLAGKEGK